MRLDARNLKAERGLHNPGLCLFRKAWGARLLTWESECPSCWCCKASVSIVWGDSALFYMFLLNLGQEWPRLELTFVLVCRPFGASILLGVCDKEGPQLYAIEPTGVSHVSFCLCMQTASGPPHEFISNKGYVDCLGGREGRYSKWPRSTSPYSPQFPDLSSESLV